MLYLRNHAFRKSRIWLTPQLDNPAIGQILQSRISIPQSRTFNPAITKHFSQFILIPWHINLSNESLFLPRPEFAKFSGNLLEFKNFLNSFKTHVESRVADQNTLFCLLVQHCTDPIKDKIKHLAEKGELCYQSAKKRLIKEYGSCWVVLDVCGQKLKSFPLIKHGDAKELKRFAD